MHTSVGGTCRDADVTRYRPDSTARAKGLAAARFGVGVRAGMVPGSAAPVKWRQRSADRVAGPCGDWSSRHAPAAVFRSAGCPFARSTRRGLTKERGGRGGRLSAVASEDIFAAVQGTRIANLVRLYSYSRLRRGVPGMHGGSFRSARLSADLNERSPCGPGRVSPRRWPQNFVHRHRHRHPRRIAEADQPDGRMPSGSVPERQAWTARRPTPQKCPVGFSASLWILLDSLAVSGRGGRI